MYSACLEGKWRKITASVTPAALAISFVVVPLKPLRANRSSAVSINCLRRSFPDMRLV
jgi:hypothetical protein